MPINKDIKTSPSTFDDPIFDPKSMKVGGWQYSAMMIFYNEIMAYSGSRSNPPVFGYGNIIAVLSSNTYKVNLTGFGTVVATSSESSWGPTNFYLVGAIVLVLCENGNQKFTILAARQTGIYAPNPIEIPV